LLQQKLLKRTAVQKIEAFERPEKNLSIEMSRVIGDLIIIRLKIHCLSSAFDSCFQQDRAVVLIVRRDC